MGSFVHERFVNFVGKDHYSSIFCNICKCITVFFGEDATGRIGGVIHNDDLCLGGDEGSDMFEIRLKITLS